MAEQKAKFWKFVFYPESAPPDWQEVIENWGVPCVVSPLHDSDVDGNGELKKPHYHGIIQYDGPTQYHLAVELVQELGTNHVVKSQSRRRDERYLAHLDSPGKALYDVADIQTWGGYTVKFLADCYEQDGIACIHELVEELGIIYYCDLANEIIENHKELMTTLLRYPAHFNNFCYSRERFAKRVKEAVASEDKAITELMSSYAFGRFRIGRIGGE